MRYLKGINLFIKNRRHLRSNNFEQKKREKERNPCRNFKAAASSSSPLSASDRSILSRDLYMIRYFFFINKIQHFSLTLFSSTVVYSFQKMH
jgi:hypothetical protein